MTDNSIKTKSSKRKGPPLPWWKSWATPIPFHYEADASLEYTLKIIDEMRRDGYWFGDEIEVKTEPHDVHEEHSFSVRYLNGRYRTPSTAFLEGRVYKVTRQTVIVEGAAYVDAARFYHPLILPIIALVVFNLALIIVLMDKGLSLLVIGNLTFLGMSLATIRFPWSEQHKILERLNEALQRISKTTNPYQKPPKRLRARLRPRPPTMQKRS